MVTSKKRLTFQDKIDHLAELAWHCVNRPTMDDMREMVIDTCNMNRPLRNALLHFLETYGLLEVFGRCRRHPNSSEQDWIKERFDFEI